MNKYANYTKEQLEELFSSYLLSSWSYSQVMTFARNEKAFEKEYVYREKSRRSAGSIAGNAYHEAVALYFERFSKGIETTIVDMEQVAFTYIDNVPANTWKLQKTTPSIEECQAKATKLSLVFIYNFIDEVDVYLSEIDEVLGVELRCTEWLVINGVDIPLPCHAVIDLVVRLKNGKIAIIDHKSKAKISEDKEVSFVGGKQAITYVLCLETGTQYKVDEAWFVENKSSKNKDSSPQLKKFKITLDEDTRRLYEAMLYEPLRRVIEAVADPDYIFLINDSDNFIDKEELYEFWAKTMIAEVSDFDIQDVHKALIIKRLKKIRDASMASINPKTISAYREHAASFIQYDLNNKDMTNSEKIEHRLRHFNLRINVAHQIDGYSSDTFLVDMGAGVKISNVMNYKLDIAAALNVSSVRVGKDLMIHEGKAYLSVETPKKRTKDLLYDKSYLVGEQIPIGVDNFGRTIYWDLNNHATPHMLICGATGSGKSVSIKATIEYARAAGITDIVLFDPKYEFVNYNGNGIRVFNEIEDIEREMKAQVDNMQRRAKSGKTTFKTLLVFDEFADAVAAARSGKQLDIKEMLHVGEYKDGRAKTQLVKTGEHKSLEENLKILLQKGRSLGFRIIAATQRASVQVITGDAKVNFPVVICFRVPKEIDSKVVLDEPGAEALAGMGDGLMKSPEYSGIVRFQGFYKN